MLLSSHAWAARSHQPAAYHKGVALPSMQMFLAVTTLIVLQHNIMPSRRCTGKATTKMYSRQCSSLHEVLAAFTRPPAAHSSQLVAPLLLWYRCWPCTTPLQR